MSETIYFNGKKYEGVAEMPLSVRQTYEKFNRFLVDENKDGVPDVIQSGGLSGLKEAFNLIKDVGQISASGGFDSGEISIIRITDTGIYVNGKGYYGVDEMPSHVRKTYLEAVNSAQDGRADIYDEAWRKVDRDDFFTPHDDEILNRQNYQPEVQYNAPIESVNSNNRFIFLAAAAIFFFGVLAIVWFLFI